ncbi:xylulokinase [Arthrobacter sp. JUb119]|uniref:FGGY family carbohydrate kinase n=1 Tax=Arthrobacter sp. JUb115 TaxID=2485108 RepID=UPI00105C3701|nr:FGGY family carbohydrate kinase [Arthrobacter sp. JUb115]MCS3494428.1 xylulokinase [Arthrobacter sp. JUb119]TDU22521.1 gluconate kinase (FGGY family) [Arthrobacter sp. JUb115]
MSAIRVTDSDHASNATLIAGIDSSTQSCKVTVRDLATGKQVRWGKASHPSSTIVDPEVWWEALLTAVRRAGGFSDVSAISISGQQHTPIFLDVNGSVTTDSPLWNDLGSHSHMVALNDELGKDEWIKRTGLPITLSDTVSKLRWLKDERPDAADRTFAVAVVHDWLSWRLMGEGPGGNLARLMTDRSEASGTGYWSPDNGDYCLDLVKHALGKEVLLPKILGPTDVAGVTGRGIPGIPEGIPIGVGSGDNAAAALSLGINNGDVVMSLGTSGVVYTRSDKSVHDLNGYVCNYADATGKHLPLVATFNAARNFEAGAALLNCSYTELSELALQANPGAGGLTLLPFFEGERTPDLPTARASLHDATLGNFTRPNFARAIIEGTLASQVGMLDALKQCGLESQRLLLIGGAAPSAAVQTVLSQLVDLPMIIPEPDEYVAKGAAMQAAAALDGEFPQWQVEAVQLPPMAHESRILDQHQSAMDRLGYLN